MILFSPKEMDIVEKGDLIPFPAVQEPGLLPIKVVERRQLGTITGLLFELTRSKDKR
jgi:hypothetical protein